MEDAYDDMPMGWFMLGGFIAFVITLSLAVALA